MRKATPVGVVIGVVLALLFSVILLGTAHRYLGKKGDGADNADMLVERAEAALNTVRQRDLRSTLRPAKYDEILRPLDEMLRMARQVRDNDAYDPIGDYDRIAAYCQAVIRIAADADEQATSETSILRKRYRFMEQKGTALQYQATSLWNRLESLHERAVNGGGDRNGFVPSGGESEKLFAMVDDGLAADPENKELWYLRGILSRANGLFAAAETDLKKAIDLDPDYGAAWNVLGLVLIRLHDFDRSGKAFATAAEKLSQQAERTGAPPGAEYMAVMFNLARVHGAQLSHYERLGRIDPSPEYKAEELRHRRGMENTLRSIMSRAAAGSPEYGEARKMLVDVK